MVGYTQFGSFSSQQLTQVSRMSVTFGTILSNSYTDRATLAARNTYNKALSDIGNKVRADNAGKTPEVEIDFSKKYQDILNQNQSRDKDRLQRKQDALQKKMAALNKLDGKDPQNKRQKGLVKLEMAEVKLEMLQKTSFGQSSKSRANQLQSIVNTVQSAIGYYTSGVVKQDAPNQGDLPEGSTVKTSTQVKSLDDLEFERGAQSLISKVKSLLRSEKLSAAYVTGPDFIKTITVLNKTSSDIFKVEKTYNELINTMNSRKTYKVTQPVDITV